MPKYKFWRFLNRISKKIKSKWFLKLKRENDSNKISFLLSNAILSDNAFMIARFGATELMCLINYIGVKNGKPNLFKYACGNRHDWWWNTTSLDQIYKWSGFFPSTILNVEKFCKLLLTDLEDLDLLASWLTNEVYLKEKLEHFKKINAIYLDPFWSKIPWTKSLKGKKVLVVHPFAQTIESQYKKRELLFKENLLPSFQLQTIQAVQSIAGTQTQFTDWFEALDYMKSEIDKRDYDICLIGCGAYGFPLAAHVKRMGKMAIHMGGSLQLLFGIKGKRWENLKYHPIYNYAELINEHWVYPSESEKPQNADSVEGSCYW
jgi:hypothetical protein